MRYVIYVMIGCGVVAGIEVATKQDLGFYERAVVTFAWPTVVTGALVASFQKKGEK